MGQKYYGPGPALRIIKCRYCDNEAAMRVNISGVGKNEINCKYEYGDYICEKCLLGRFVDELLHIYNEG